MTTKNNLIILIFLITLSFVFSENTESEKYAPINGTDYPGIQCGKKEPKKKKDCTKFGTDSGMLCCWVSDSPGESREGQCTLLSKDKASEKKIKGEKFFENGNNNDKYWDCGNESIYLNINLFLFFVFLFITIL